MAVKDWVPALATLAEAGFRATWMGAATATVAAARAAGLALLVAVMVWLPAAAGAV